MYKNIGQGYWNSDLLSEVSLSFQWSLPAGFSIICYSQTLNVNKFEFSLILRLFLMVVCVYWF